MKAARGTIVDAIIINAPSSIKNKDKTRDPGMHQTIKPAKVINGTSG